MGLLMLRQDWPGEFKRVVRTPKGDVKKVLTFKPGEPVELKGAALAAVQRAIGSALLEVELDPKGRPRVIQPAEEANGAADKPTPETESEEATVGGDIEG